MEDFGPTGASLLMGFPVEKGSRVTIAIGSDRTFHGLVRTCRLEPSGYLVSVTLPTADNPAADQYRPEHFLDASRLDLSPLE